METVVGRALGLGVKGQGVVLFGRGWAVLAQPGSTLGRAGPGQLIKVSEGIRRLYV